MAQRRMFSKSITSSSAFLKMPATSRLLYYDLGMSADDDGYCEHFGVMKMTGSSDQDLSVLAINGFIKVFDENVLIILHWKENNYIQKDRYTPSRYLDVYSMDTKCIQNVNTGKDRLGKVRLVKSKEIDVSNNKKTVKKGEIKNIDSLTDEYCGKLATHYQISIDTVLEKRNDLILYCKANGKKYKDYQAALQSWLRRDFNNAKKK